ncbi:MAG: crosslink repair DNA glycosylase YcaQ family protein [Woeseiaceae bacterium]
MRRVRLSRDEACRVALAAQGFDRGRPAGNPDVRHFRRVIDTLGLLQLDYVNVLMPAQLLVLWSRLGAYDRNRFERFVYGKGEYTEQWAHEASIVPAASWPLLEYRRKSYEMHKNNPLRKLRGRQAYLDAVLRQVAENGALTAHDLPPAPGPKRNPGDWHRSMPRRALEYHFSRGDLVVADRLPNFQRVYDLPERVLPREHLETTLTVSDAQRELLRMAARALGVATMHDLADYYRMSPRVAAPLVQDLVDEGTLNPIEVDGWGQDAYLASGARLPRAIDGVSLLSPFDPVVWFRPRAERLFDFHYRIEIYVPAAKRRWGYYVLPFRSGDKIAGRVDLKADRKTGRLLVLNAHEEDSIDIDHCCDGLNVELHALKDWLGLDEVFVEEKNHFSRRLREVVH